MRSVQIVRVIHGISIIIILLSETGTVVGHRCYICGGEGSGQLENIFPGETFPSCDIRFDVKQCPPNHMGCLTQTNGTKITKSCGHLGLDTCKTANKVEYCYCKGDLCNGDSKLQPIPPPAKSPTSPPASSSNEDDDEDLTEGSASGPYRGGRVKSTTDDFESLVHSASPTPTTRASSGVSSNFSNLSSLIYIGIISITSLFYCIPFE